jgi:hypothetical protein
MKRGHSNSQRSTETTLRCERRGRGSCSWEEGKNGTSQTKENRRPSEKRNFLPLAIVAVSGCARGASGCDRHEWTILSCSPGRSRERERERGSGSVVWCGGWPKPFVRWWKEIRIAMASAAATFPWTGCRLMHHGYRRHQHTARSVASWRTHAIAADKPPRQDAQTQTPPTKTPKKTKNPCRDNKSEEHCVVAEEDEEDETSASSAAAAASNPSRRRQSIDDGGGLYKFNPLDPQRLKPPGDPTLEP